MQLHMKYKCRIDKSTQWRYEPKSKEFVITLQYKTNNLYSVRRTFIYLNHMKAIHHSHFLQVYSLTQYRQQIRETNLYFPCSPLTPQSIHDETFNFYQGWKKYRWTQWNYYNFAGNYHHNEDIYIRIIMCLF